MRAFGLMVKANAYGHGLEMGARAAVDGGADRFIVASLDEGLALRLAGLAAPILVAYPVSPDVVGDAVEAGLELSVSGLGSTRRTLEAWAGSASPASPVRCGSTWRSTPGWGAVAFRRRHSPTSCARSTRRRPRPSRGSGAHARRRQRRSPVGAQSERFESALAAVAATGRPIPARHLVATDGVFTRSAPAYDMVRVGLASTASWGSGWNRRRRRPGWPTELMPAMTVKALPVRLEALPPGASVGYGSEWKAERRP